MTKPVSVEVIVDEAVFERLEDSGFVSEWHRLYEACGWATSFQSFAFVDAWYRLHHLAFEPVLVEGRDEMGRLIGLMALTRRRTGRLLVGAGDIHAEYQGWIAEEWAVSPFMWRSLELLERRYPRGRLQFRYLPRATTLGWVDGGSRWPRRVNLRRFRVGLIDLSDQSLIEAPLRKGHNRSRLNQLRRFGDVSLESIESVEALEREMDEIEVLCDLRQGALHDSLPFSDNPLKRPLHLDLMRSGLLYATVLRVGPKVASVHLDMRNGDEVLIYLIVHAPAFAKYSPGSLHMLMLAARLSGEGYARYDLSPGGGYKDRFATQQEPIFRMTAQFGLADRAVVDISARAMSAAIRILAAFGRTPRSSIDALRQSRDRLLLRPNKRRAASPARPALVVSVLPGPADSTGDLLMRDHLADLLTYRPNRPEAPSIQAFLRTALRRLEAGQSVLTRTEGSVLVECWWIVRLPTMPGHLLYGLPLEVGSQGRGLIDRLARTMWEIDPGVPVYVGTSAGDTVLLGALLEVGAVQVAGESASPALREELTSLLAREWPTDDPEPV